LTTQRKAKNRAQGRYKKTKIAGRLLLGGKTRYPEYEKNHINMFNGGRGKNYRGKSRGGLVKQPPGKNHKYLKGRTNKHEKATGMRGKYDPRKTNCKKSSWDPNRHYLRKRVSGQDPTNEVQRSLWGDVRDALSRGRRGSSKKKRATCRTLRHDLSGDQNGANPRHSVNINM